MRILTVVVCFGFLICGFACKETPPQPYVQSVFLSVEDAGVTDAFLKVHLLIPDSLSEVVIKRNGQRVLSARLGNRTDTLVVDDSLSPNQTYTYKAYRSSQVPFDSSDAVTVRTMDTTSHNFTWQIDTLGDGNSSRLNDVAIINDTLAYAVGEMYLKDSTGRWDTEPYSIAVWNGRSWKLKRVYPQCDGCQGSPPVRARGIFAFSTTDVWLADGTVWHWDGVSNTTFWRSGPFPSPDAGAEKLWGTSSNNLYAVGRNGVIAHYSSGTWRRMESGTDVDLLDVWGSPDGSIVWACGWIDFKPTVLLRLQAGGQWEKAWEENNPFTQRDDTLSGAFTSVWLPNNRQFFALSWYGVYSSLITTHGEGKRIPFPSTWSGFPRRLRGKASNDLVIVGEYYMLAHFNGMTFKHFQELSGYGRLVSVDQQNNFVVAVGYLFDPIHSKGLVFRGRRN
ncbi:MAG: hypothetical protein HY277_07110 [Ignavibacteriales bacterium]|nr:hypothetical protein [Ignavibacteriales bacterium]